MAVESAAWNDSSINNDGALVGFLSVPEAGEATVMDEEETAAAAAAGRGVLVLLLLLLVALFALGALMPVGALLLAVGGANTAT